MTDHGTYLALGLMSGTSLDGVDAALLTTDGMSQATPGPGYGIHYNSTFRERLRALLDGDGDLDSIERDLTLEHAEAVSSLLKRASIGADTIDVIGFHGHTILHRPDEHLSRQIGDGALLAEHTGIDVVCDFRRRDLAAGGEGAPLIPLYHAALAANIPKPLAILNLGGVANVTWLGDGGGIVAFDTGPGCALIDDWVQRHTGASWDQGGKLAAAGRPSDVVLEHLMGHPFFTRRPPKTLDRNAFAGGAEGLITADGAATLTAFTVASVKAALHHFPIPPRRWLITGGGRKNPALMEGLGRALVAPVDPVEAVGWDGDALEAQAFAYLAVRSRIGATLTLPETTGVSRPVTGGALHRCDTAPVESKTTNANS